MRVLQARATLSSHRPHTPNEIRSAVRVRSSALFFTCKTRKNRKSPMFASGALSAVDYPKASSLGIGVLQVVAGHSRWRRRILWH
jgi:hypothetical protein